MASRILKHHRYRPWTEEEAVAALHDWVRHHGRLPAQQEWQAGMQLPSMSAILRVFGSWSNYFVAAGFEPRLGGDHREGAERRAKDEETRRLMQRAEAGASLARLGAEIGVTGQSLGRRIARYREREGLPRLDLRPGSRA